MYAWFSLLISIISTLGALLLCIFPFNFVDKGFLFDKGVLRQPSFYELLFNIQNENLVAYDYNYAVLYYFIFEILFIIFSLLTIVNVQRIDKIGRTNKLSGFFIISISIVITLKISACTCLVFAYKSFNLEINNIALGIVLYSIFELVSLISSSYTIYLVFKENRYKTHIAESDSFYRVKKNTTNALNTLLDKYQDEIIDEFNDTFKDAK